MAKKEVFAWLKAGIKTIDVRQGDARDGDTAFFQCGINCLEVQIVKRETGKLNEVITQDNYKQVIPTAKNVEDALGYLRKIYTLDDNGVFTAYYLEQTKK